MLAHASIVPPAPARIREGLPPRGSFSHTSAKRPLTCAAENELPLARPQPPPGWVVSTSRPGATKAPPWPGSLATATTPACDAGKPPRGSAGSTAPTTTVRRAIAASSSRPSRVSGGPLKLMLITCASCSTANSIALARLSVSQEAPVPAASCQQARSAISRAPGATPTIPASLSRRAAMTPATPAGRPTTKSCRQPIWPARSGWRASTALSTTATRTLRPVTIWCSSVSRQAWAAGCRRYMGSFGAAAAA